MVWSECINFAEAESGLGRQLEPMYSRQRARTIDHLASVQVLIGLLAFMVLQLSLWSTWLRNSLVRIRGILTGESSSNRINLYIPAPVVTVEGIASHLVTERHMAWKSTAYGQHLC
jgi:hypothetical protein